MEVHLVSGLHPTLVTPGGTRSYVLGLARTLAARGFDVSVVGAGPPAELPFATFLPVTSTFPLSNLEFIRSLRRWLVDHPLEDDSVVHGQRPDDLFPYLRHRKRARLVCTFHGDPRAAVARRRSYGKWAYVVAETRVVRNLSRLIFVSRGDLQTYSERYPEISRKAVVIPVGIDLDRFTPVDRFEARRSLGLEDRPTVAFVGRFEAEKRVHVLMTALRRIRTPPQTVLAGSGSREEELRRLAHGLPVRFLGILAPNGIATVLSAADVLVITSESEGLPTVALEAFACGTPVIGTRVGELSSLVQPGKTGFLFDGTPAGLAALIQERMTELAGLRSNCVDAARPYGWDSIAERVAEVYRAAG